MAKKPHTLMPTKVTVRDPQVDSHELVVAVDKLPAPMIGMVPHIVGILGTKARKRYTTFFTDEIRNKNTREAYFRNAWRFLTWCEDSGLAIQDVESYHVSAHVETLLQEYGKSTVKQHLAAIRKLFDWLIIGQVVKTNPAHAVRGPKHVITEGLTPILDHSEMQELISSIDSSTLIGKRDLALIATMTATFGRISAVLNMAVDDYYPDGKMWMIRIYEKNGKLITMPVQSDLEPLLDDYIQAVGGIEAFPFHPRMKRNKKPITMLWLSAIGKTGKLSESPLTRQDAWRMIKRRARNAGISSQIGNHSFRGTGITNYRANGGSLENAAYMAGHRSEKTTKLYDRGKTVIKRKEIEKINILSPVQAESDRLI